MAKNALSTYLSGSKADIVKYNNAIAAGYTPAEVNAYIFANTKPKEWGPKVTAELQKDSSYNSWTAGTYGSTPTTTTTAATTTTTPVKPVVPKTSYNLGDKAALFEKYVDENSDLNDSWNNAGWQNTFESKADAGYDHWIKYGKNENRIISGPAKIGYDNGQLKLINEDYIGAGAKSKYNDIINAYNTSSGGNYRQLVSSLANTVGPIKLNDLFNTSSKNALEAYYLSNKVGSPWDASTYGAQPPTGGFDATYYGNTYPDALDSWNNAQSVNVGGYSVPDLDITGRYSKETYLLQHYTNVGKNVGYRGNPPLDTEAASSYKESLTDADYQLYRDRVLGLGTPEQPAILGQEVQNVITQKDLQQQQVFGALTQDVLKQTITELNKAKSRESNLALMRQLPGYDEIYSINSTLANTLIGDSGIGGILSIGGSTEKTTKNLEKEFSKITGIASSSNSILYNWQQWFDDTLLKRYQEGVDLGDSIDAENQYQIDKEFTTKFIQDYLKPRFDTSRSMDEFVSYIDVKDNEQNIFQTQTALNSLKEYADTRAKTYLDQLKSQAPNTFNTEFYFSPTKNTLKTDLYTKQSQEVASDWEAAKNGDAFWATEAYRYGLDINNKDQFARLHYEVKGRGEGYDPAVDIVSLEDAKNFISKTLIPAVSDMKTYLGDASFLQFVTPEEFADELLQGVSPEQNKEEWDKILKQFGLTEQGLDTQQVKEYIIEALRTGAAKDIRESIKYLNEKQKTPTQEELGASYIQRAEDVKPTTSGNETALFNLFKSAGYQGSEDEFYTNFMPDVDRGEQLLLSKGGSKSGLQFLGIDTSDPFSSLASIDSLFNTTEETDSKKTDTGEAPAPSYFKLFGDTSEEPASKSKSGQQILGEFTSLFKGFS